jgi:hypothetical protein
MTLWRNVVSRSSVVEECSISSEGAVVEERDVAYHRGTLLHWVTTADILVF